MEKISEERIKLRIEYSRETEQIFHGNIPAYADWLENKLALIQIDKPTESTQKCKSEWHEHNIQIHGCCCVCGVCVKH